MKLSAQFRVTAGAAFRLERVDPGDTRGLRDAAAVADLRDRQQERLRELQTRLHADRRWSVLLIVQALDAGGKDGAITELTSGLNPHGCKVTSFKAPSEEELDHDFLWRCVRQLPARGQIGIFNRSYYEDVIVPQIHSDVRAAQRLPASLLRKPIWSERLHDIHAFERYLLRNGTLLCKVFLHVSKEEQRKRLLARLEDPSKHWKFAQQDIDRRALYARYLHCYERAIRATASARAPWYVVPGDHKWFARAVVADALIRTLQRLQLRYPHLGARAIARARRGLDA